MPLGIDSLARNGVRCSNGYVSHPYCSPTRAGLLTGTEPCEIAAEAARYYLTGRSPFIHGARGKPTFRATS